MHFKTASRMERRRTKKTEIRKVKLKQAMCFAKKNLERRARMMEQGFTMMQLKD